MIRAGREDPNQRSLLHQAGERVDRSSENYRPFFFLVGLILAVPSLILIALATFRVLYAGELNPLAAAERVGALALFYIAGVFIFCYTLKRHDLRRALVLTLLVLVVTAIGVVLLAKAVALLAGAVGLDLGSSGSSSKDSDSTSSGEGSDSGSRWHVPHGWFGSDYGTDYAGGGLPSGRKDERGNRLCPSCGQLAGNGGGLCSRCSLSQF